MHFIIELESIDIEIIEACLCARIINYIEQIANLLSMELFLYPSNDKNEQMEQCQKDTYQLYIYRFYTYICLCRAISFAKCVFFSSMNSCTHFIKKDKIYFFIFKCDFIYFSCVCFLAIAITAVGRNMYKWNNKIKARRENHTIFDCYSFEIQTFSNATTI